VKITLKRSPAAWPPIDRERVRPALPRARCGLAGRTALVGREAELVHLRHLLSNDDIRIVTLTGAPGVGKSRLAAAAAQDRVEHVGGAAAVVDVACLRDRDALLAYASSALSNCAGQTVLVLDNCDHAGRALPRVVGELLTSRAVRLVLTSRAVLSLYGEWLVPVNPLPIPGPYGTATLDELRQVPALALLLDRIRAGRPGFEFNGHNAPTLVEACRRMDGLPLAIELLARRAHTVSLSSLVDQLRAEQDVLFGGPIDAPQRHRTMRRAIAYSFGRLAAAERQVFMRLSALPNPFSLASVAELTGLTHERANDIVESLVRQSLLTAVEDGAGDRLFTMAGIIRSFATGKLQRLPVDSSAPASAATASPGTTRPVEGVPAARLTPRQLEVASLVAQGLTNGQISNRLSISVWTVINHLREVMKKLDCPSRVYVARRMISAPDGRPVQPIADDSTAATTLNSISR
jgi:DNA-binding CsgD family transcriptional regulator